LAVSPPISLNIEGEIGRLSLDACRGTAVKRCRRDAISTPLARLVEDLDGRARLGRVVDRELDALAPVLLEVGRGAFSRSPLDARLGSAVTASAAPRRASRKRRKTQPPPRDASRGFAPKHDFRAGPRVSVMWMKARVWPPVP
jgi:hypothetical protein